MNHTAQKWKHIISIDDALSLVDIGHLLTSRDIPLVKKTLSNEEGKRLVQHFAERFAERYEDRDAAEILLESCLLWLHYNRNENYVIAFLETIFEHSKCKEVIFAFISLGFNIEILEPKKAVDILELVVFITAQMGIQTEFLIKQYPKIFSDHKAIPAYISSTMMGVSNISSFRVRMCLMNYFIHLEVLKDNEKNFEKIMDRFGSTILNQLFAYLFHKKTKKFASHYILENISYMLLCNQKTQTILQDTFRYNMLKYPMKFAMFLKFFTAGMLDQATKLSKDKEHRIIKTYLMHLATLLKIVSKLDQPKLSKEIFLSLCSFDHYEFSQSFLRSIIASNEIREYYVRIFEKILPLKGNHHRRKLLDAMPALEFHNAGKRTNFHHKPCSVYMQIFLLGSKQSVRANKVRDPNTTLGTFKKHDKRKIA